MTALPAIAVLGQYSSGSTALAGGLHPRKGRRQRLKSLLRKSAHAPHGIAAPLQLAQAVLATGIEGAADGHENDATRCKGQKRAPTISERKALALLPAR